MALANREPNLVGDWIYQLEMTELGDWEHEYPCFKVGNTITKDFTTLFQAEKYIREQSLLTPIYRSRITQIPPGGDNSERGAQWLYDGHGTLVDCTTVQKSGNPEETHFFGRPFEKQRFGLGDVVELLQGDTVSLGMVFFPIRPPEESWTLYREERSEYDLDYRCDSHAIVVDESGKIEVALITALMPPRFEITSELANELSRWYAEVFQHPERQGCIRIIPVYDDENGMNEIDSFGPNDDIPADGIPISDEELAELEEELVKAKLRRGY